jgi:hypothetical protein
MGHLHRHGGGRTPALLRLLMRAASRMARLPIGVCVRSVSLSMWLLVISGATFAMAQSAPDTPPVGATTVFPHATDARWWLSGQVNLISQTYGRFTSPYEGDNSLRPQHEQALPRLWTIYAGVKVPGRTEWLFDVESAGGRGLSDALGPRGVHEPGCRPEPDAGRGAVHRAR